jgi:hypothetical protein
VENKSKTYHRNLPFVAIGIVLASIVIAFFIYSMITTEIDSGKAAIKAPDHKTTSPTQQIQQTQKSTNPTQNVPFHRKVYTPAFTGAPSVIFRMDDVAKGWNEVAVEQIIKLFGKNSVPLDIGIIPHADGRDSYAIPFLKEYLDVGIIDISIHGDTHAFAEVDTDKSNIPFRQITSGLVKARSQIQKYYGLDPIAFTAPNDFFNEDGYRAVQDAGFKIFSTQRAVESYPSVLPLYYNGAISEAGMSRLCTVSDVAAWDASTQQWGEILPADSDSPLFNSIEWGLKALGVAVVGIHPQAFLDSSGNIDSAKIDRLDAIIKIVKQKNAIVTFDGWYGYATMEIMGPQHVRLKKTPKFTGGPAIIFRMDDVSQGLCAETVDEVIKIFQKNEVPMDAGVEPFANGQSSYRMPCILRYVDSGVVDISVHGYKNTFLEFDTELSGVSYNQLDPSLKGCFQNSYDLIDYKPVKTNYDSLKAGLQRTREQYKRYFGDEPVSFTVPYDYFNFDGYRAVQDAGFKVFSAQLATDPFPSAIQPIYYLGGLILMVCTISIPSLILLNGTPHIASGVKYCLWKIAVTIFTTS